MKTVTKPKAGEHFIYPHFLTQRVQVIVVGCGGNGSQLLTGLARLDRALKAVGHPGGLSVIACDPDNVSESNVGRQLFSPADIGQNKAVVLTNRINAFFGLDWKAEPSAFLADGRGFRCDILITCTDTAKSRREIGAFSENSNGCKYWLDLGNRGRDGQVILGQVAAPSSGSARLNGNWEDGFDAKKALEKLRLPHVLDIFPELRDPTFQEDTAPSCSLAEALQKQDLFINQAVVTFALDLLWRLFRDGKINRHGAFINLIDGEVRPLPVPA